MGFWICINLSRLDQKSLNKKVWCKFDLPEVWMWFDGWDLTVYHASLINTQYTTWLQKCIQSIQNGSTEVDCKMMHQQIIIKKDCINESYCISLFLLFSHIFPKIWRNDLFFIYHQFGILRIQIIIRYENIFTSFNYPCYDLQYKLIYNTHKKTLHYSSNRNQLKCIT